MLKVILKTFTGLILLAAGIGIVYYYLKNIDNSSNALLLLPAFSFLIVAIFLLIHTGKSDESIVQKPAITNEVPPESISTHKENLIERNNEMSSAWAKSVVKKDKMRVLAIAAKAEEEPLEGKQ